MEWGGRKVGELTLNPSQTKEALQKISELYKIPENVVFEYIQNSIDSASSLVHDKGVQREFFVIVHIIDGIGVVVQDNCEGMTLEFLQTLPLQIFSSRKKKSPWVVGKFGYGIQSFRAFFKELTLLSKTQHDFKASDVQFKANTSKYIIEEKKGDLRDLGDPYIEIFDSNLSGVQKDRYNQHICTLIENLNLPERISGTDVFLIGKLSNARRGRAARSFEHLYEELENKMSVHFDGALRNSSLNMNMYLVYWIKRNNYYIPINIKKIQPLKIDDLPGREFSFSLERSGKEIAHGKFKVVSLDDVPNENLKRKIKEYIPYIANLGTMISYLKDLGNFTSVLAKRNLSSSILEDPWVIGYVETSVEFKEYVDLTRTGFRPGVEIVEELYEKLADKFVELKEHLEREKDKKRARNEKQLGDFLSVEVIPKISKQLDLDLSGNPNIFTEGTIPITDEGDEVFDLLKTSSVEKSENEQKNKEGESTITSTFSDPITKNEGSEMEDGVVDNSRRAYVKNKGLKIEFLNAESDEPARLIGDTLQIYTLHPLYLRVVPKGRRTNLSAYLLYLSTVIAPAIIIDNSHRKDMPISEDTLTKDLYKVVLAIHSKLTEYENNIKALLEVNE